MRDPTKQSLCARLLGSIAFQFTLFVGIVVAYNRIVFALHTPSGGEGFSDFAAPLYAFRQPIPAISVAVLARWIVPILIAAAWMILSLKWIRAREVNPNAHGAAVGPQAHRSPHWSLASMTRTALGVVLILNLATAMMDAGVRSITWPFSRSGEEYFGDAGRVHDPIAFLRDYPTLNLARHPRTHPPGGVMFLWAVRKIFGDSLLASSLAASVVTALTALPAAMLARRMLSPRGAAICIGLYVLAPNLVLFGVTSMDGVFTCALVTTAYFFFTAAMDDSDWRGTVLHGIHVGLWLALSTFLTFASFAMVVLFVVFWLMQWVVEPRRGARTALILFTTAITLVACFVALWAFTGCNMIACVRASMAFDAEKMRNVRAAYLDTSVTNLLGFLVGSGLIAATLWMRGVGETCRLKSARREGVGIMSLSLAITLLMLSFSTLFTRELERIWMFFTPLLLIGAADALDRIELPSLRGRWIVTTMILLFAQTWATQLFLNTVW